MGRGRAHVPGDYGSAGLAAAGRSGYVASVADTAELREGACGRQLKSGRWCNHAALAGQDTCRLHQHIDRMLSERALLDRERREAEQERVMRRYRARHAILRAAEQGRIELTREDGLLSPIRLSVLLAQLVAAVERWHSAAGPDTEGDS